MKFHGKCPYSQEISKKVNWESGKVKIIQLFPFQLENHLHFSTVEHVPQEELGTHVREKVKLHHMA